MEAYGVIGDRVDLTKSPAPTRVADVGEAAGTLSFAVDGA